MLRSLKARLAAAPVLSCALLVVTPALACTTQFLPTTIESDADCIFRLYSTDGVPSSGASNPSKLDIQSLFGVIASTLLGASGQFGVLQNGLNTPGGTMTGYAKGDTITLTCSGMTFTQAPVVGVNHVTGGVVDGAQVAFSGLAVGPLSGNLFNCSQASSSGSGAGYTTQVTLGPIAAYVPVAGLGSGSAGGYNGSLYLNQGGDAPPSYNAGSENTFVGDKAGFGLGSFSSFSDAFGHNACGSGAGAAINSSFNICDGNDAGRNISAGASAGNLVLIGFDAGRNIAGGYDVFIGAFAADNNQVDAFGSLTSYNTVAIGYEVAQQLRAGIGHLLLGAKAGSQIVNGDTDIILAATTGGDNCANGDESDVFAVCPGAGRVFTITGGATPSTSAATIAGKLAVVGTPTSAGSGGLYLCIDSAGQTYKKASCP